MRPAYFLSPSSVPWRSIDASRPDDARIYDYWLGGKDNFAVDREFGDRIVTVFPGLRTAALENRRFLQRVVYYLTARAGIRQFLDIGTGILTFPNVHEVAQDVIPDARVVYVDKDPIVVAFSRACMSHSMPEGLVAYLWADLRSPEQILSDPQLRVTLDLTQPVGLIIIAVIHFLDDVDCPQSSVARLVDALPTGSYLALSHFSFDLVPPERAPGFFLSRTRDEISKFFDGLMLVEPGLVPIVHWQGDQYPMPEASVVDTGVYGAVARKP